MTMTTTWEPTVVTPGSAGVEASARGLLARLADPAALASELLAAKALRFEGFGVSEAELPGVLDLLLPHRMAYVHGNSPRTQLGANVYTSTEYPAEYTISMHNELSYAHSWPTRLAFFCARQPASGGSTPVVDGAAWLAALPPRTRSDFAGGLRYQQNLHGGRGLGRSWQDTFETTDRAVVERYLTRAHAQWSWATDGSVRISQVRPATIVHPVTGQQVWFNQVDQWHPAGLEGEVARELAQLLPEEELPQSVRFADGRPIPEEQVLEVRDAGLANACNPPWHTGDLMLIDNIAVGHGRRAYTGDRRVLVAMSD